MSRTDEGQAQSAQETFKDTANQVSQSLRDGATQVRDAAQEKLRQVRDQARSDWIGDDGQNDGNGGRGALDRLSCKRSLHDDYIDFALD